MVYESDDGGRPAIFIRPFPDGPVDSAREVSGVDGGTGPRWREDGLEIVYGLLARAGGAPHQLMRVPVRQGARGGREAVALTLPAGTRPNQIAMTADAQRFLVPVAKAKDSGPLIVVTDLKSLIAAR